MHNTCINQGSETDSRLSGKGSLHLLVSRDLAASSTGIKRMMASEAAERAQKYAGTDTPAAFERPNPPDLMG